MSQPITINLNRGLKGMAEGLIRRFPHGGAILNNGLRAVIHRSIDENPQTPNVDFSAVQLAEHLGIIQPEQPKRIEPRRRKR